MKKHKPIQINIKNANDNIIKCRIIKRYKDIVAFDIEIDNSVIPYLFTLVTENDYYAIHIFDDKTNTCIEVSFLDFPYSNGWRMQSWISHKQSCSICIVKI